MSRSFNDQRLHALVTEYRGKLLFDAVWNALKDHKATAQESAAVCGAMLANVIPNQGGPTRNAAAWQLIQQVVGEKLTGVRPS